MQPPHGKIARASTADISDFIRLGEDAHLSPWSAQNYLDELKLPNAIVLKLVAEDGSFLGFVVGRVITHAEEESGEAEVYNIAVVAPQRHLGLGQLLLDAFIDAAREKGAAAVWLEVRESNEPARSFYSKNNFAPIQTRKNFYTDPIENAILMKLDLSS